ncbi:MAG TPA: hypothetical protein VFN35_18800, partial [Ktedonobacteraceae bacterium]|nr:hypothetical protein [Ktedonobacteraceae bacterium]
MSIQREYFQRLAAAYVRGKLKNITDIEHSELFQADLEILNEQELQQIIQVGEEHELRLHRFKRSMALPRVQKVLGILRGLQPANLLDIGSGRGVFLWPLLDTFPYLPITCLDLLEYRVNDILAVRDGGV